MRIKLWRRLYSATDSEDTVFDQSFLVEILGFGLFLSVLSLAGYIDVAPTTIFTSSDTIYMIDYLSGELTSDFIIRVSARSKFGVKQGVEIPPVESFLGLWNLVGVLSFSLLSSIILIYFPEKAYYRYHWSSLWCMVLGVLVYSGLLILVIFWSLLTGLLNNYIVPTRTIVLILHLIAIYLLLWFYSKPISEIAYFSNVEILSVYLQTQWRRVQGILSVGIAVAFGGGVAFASSGSTRLIPVALLVGALFFPILTTSCFSYWRMKKAEEHLILMN